jgi:exodeoxyribonuclease V alpha subunit
MVLRNDPVLKLFNGDIGITLPDENGTLMVVFPDAAGGFRCVAPVRMPEHQTAFAMTVHKAQGSQWDNVYLFDESFAFREHRQRWLYTALTRAAKQITVVV